MNIYAAESASRAREATLMLGSRLSNEASDVIQLVRSNSCKTDQISALYHSKICIVCAYVCLHT